MMNIWQRVTSKGWWATSRPDFSSGGAGASQSEKGGRKAASVGALSDPEGGDSAATPPDVELVRSAQQGDQQAFAELVTRHRDHVYAMTLRMVKNEADAWDLAQEAFIKAWKALPRFEARARFSTWLFRITHNVVYDWLRKRRLEVSGELDDELLGRAEIATGSHTTPAGRLRPDQALERAELRARLEEAIARLSDTHREVILLREVQGMDYKEIAEVCECSSGTVMSRLFYARKKLQEILLDD